MGGAPGEVLEACASLGTRTRREPGETLIHAGSRTGALHVLLEGRVEVRLPGAGGSALVAQLAEGEVLGEIQLVTGQAATTDVVAITPCTVLELDGGLLRAIPEAFPAFEERLSQLASQRLRKLAFRAVVHDLLRGVKPALVDEFIAGATEVVLPRGERLFSQGDAADAWYVLTSGRLGVIAASARETHKVADLMPGASVGEMALIGGAPRNATIVAERRASLMRVSKESFERFADDHPAFARRLMEKVVQRLSESSSALEARGRPVLAVLRASASPRLEAAFGQLGASMRRLAGAAVRGRADFEAAAGCRIDASVTEAHPLWGRFDVWIEEAQGEHPMVLVDAGHEDDAWRRECLLHADRCIWLAEPVADDAPRPEPALREALRAAREWARRDSQRLPWWLVVAHPPGTEAPRNTRAWLDGEDFDRHLHARLDDAPSMERTARLLAGRGHGLVLSGGGARGLAHIGVLKAFAELDIPIDCIGGTSIGAIQAGMFAMGLSIERMRSLNQEVMARRPFQEYTLPLISLVASRRRDECIRHCFADVQIEDLWIPYLAVSTDLRSARTVVHERGSLGLAASASSSLPGVMVPIVDGERILVDGGIVDNMPADHVHQRAGGTVFGVTVTPMNDLVVPDGGFPSPWRLVWHRLVPRRKRSTAPRLGDLLLRTMTVGSTERMAEAMRSVDVLIEPDIANIGMMQFKAIDSLVDKGYVAGMDALRRWLHAR